MHQPALQRRRSRDRREHSRRERAQGVRATARASSVPRRGLTGLANRVLFRDRVEHALARVDRGSSLAVLFLDLDDFKTVNDTLGHQAGDELIRVVAGRIASTARTADTAARLGGDEFAILMEDDANDASDLVAKRLLEGIAAQSRSRTGRSP